MITVNGFTIVAVQQAIDISSPGDTIFFPPGEYLFDNTVTVNKSLTLLGASGLQDVCVVEPGEPNDPPYWDGTPSFCHAENGDVGLFEVEADNVGFKNLKLKGQTTHQNGEGTGILFYESNYFMVKDCEISRFCRGVECSQSRHGIITGCYIHENYFDGLGYGISVVGTQMAVGGSEVNIYENEFTLNRHAIASNSPETKFAVENNYFHDNDLSQLQACVDTHPHGGTTLRVIVRNNIFERTRPMGFKSGSMEITGNYFDPGCGDFSVGGYSRMINFGDPEHNGVYVPLASLHDIYIGNNINDTDPEQWLFTVDNYVYPGNEDTMFVVYNMFVEGSLFTYNEYDPSEQFAFPDSCPKPFVGYIFVTQPGSEELTDTIEINTWYDMHVMAVDPQGSGDILEIAVQIVDTTQFDHTPDIINEGTFSASGNYFMRCDENNVYLRQDEGSTLWSNITGTEGLYIDGSNTTWDTNGSHRIHLITRFKLLEQALHGKWHFYAYVSDMDNNLPVSAWYENQEGWPIYVDSSNTVFIETTPLFKDIPLYNNYPNPFSQLTTISYKLAATGQVIIGIYNLTGKEVRTLVNKNQKAGKYSVV